MTEKIDQKYIKFFYLSDFCLSLALGMIPLMTVLSYFISSLSTSTFAYALILALYNIASSYPKMYVAKNLSGKKNTFGTILKLKTVQIFIWLVISIIFFTVQNTTVKTALFCGLYLTYAFIKGSIEVLNIDIYSKVISSNILGKFFGYKHSFNSLAEFIGAMMLVSLFNFFEIEVNYGIIFFIVFLLDFISLMLLFALRNKIHLSDVNVNNSVGNSQTLIKKTGLYITDGRNGILKGTLSEIKDILQRDTLLKSFLMANIISIIGATVASFFIPFGTEKLQLTIDSISVANAIWLVSKVASSIFWGYIVDMVGAKYTMIGSRLLLMVSYLIAINLETVGMFYLLLILHGISSSALVIMAQNIFIEIGDKNGPLYSAINSVVCLPFFVLMPLIANIISSTFGYELSFALSIIPLIVSIVLMFKVKLYKNKRAS